MRAFLMARKALYWSAAPTNGELKFNVYDVARGKSGPARLSGYAIVKEFLAIFSKHVGCLDTNEVKLLAILEALHMFTSHFYASLVVESDLTNDVHWVSSSTISP